MSFEDLKRNVKNFERILNELYTLTNQLEILNNLETNLQRPLNKKEKDLLVQAINSLTNQLRIINNSFPALLNEISIFKKISPQKSSLTKITYKPLYFEKTSPQTLTITEEDRKKFLKELERSNLSTLQLKKEYGIKKPEKNLYIGKVSGYAKLSNYFFRNLSNNLISKGYFESLNRNLRKINSPFTLNSYVSMIFFTTFLFFLISIPLLTLLLFFNLSLVFPFISPAKEPVLERFVRYFWILIALPLSAGTLFYFYPASEAKSLGSKINRELPFVSIHMAAVATAGMEPVNIFKIILKSEEYPYTNLEFRKLMNLINFHGKDLVTSLREVSKSCPSTKLKDLLDGMATAITSGSSLTEFLNKHAENLLFDYKLERERYMKISETFMNLYISIAIAAPMIFLVLFVLLGATGTFSVFLGMGTKVAIFLIILIVVLINLLFLWIIKMKQPEM